MPSRDACCFDKTRRCHIDRHYYITEKDCIDGDTDELCSNDPIHLPRACYDYTRLHIQCCDGKFVEFGGWVSSYSHQCRDSEERRVNFNHCPQIQTPYASTSHLNFVTICIVVTVVVILFGLAFVIFKRLRYQSRAAASSDHSSTISPNGRPPRRSAPTRGVNERPPTGGGRGHPPSSRGGGGGPEAPFQRAPSVCEEDMAPPSYEEAIMLSNQPGSDRPPAFDKIT